MTTPNGWFPPVRVPPLRGGAVLRWGVLAPGTIAGDFVATVRRNTDQKVTAVASRSSERGRSFADRHAIERVHASYEALVADPGVDIVYVAAPHSEHAKLGLLAIAAGKHVLIEKPIATSAGEAKEIAAAARSAGVFAAEAMWTRYLPQFDVLDQLLQRGDLGTIRLATADVGWAMGADPPPRLLDPDLAGGAALDMGVYGSWFAQFAIGRPQLIRALGRLAWQTTAIAHYIDQGRTDSPVHGLDDAIGVLHTIDTVRAQLGGDSGHVRQR